MNCKQCGTPVPDDTTTCPKCGAEQTQPFNPSIPSSSVPPKNKLLLKQRKLSAAAGILFLVYAVYTAFNLIQLTFSGYAVIYLDFLYCLIFIFAGIVLLIGKKGPILPIPFALLALYRLFVFIQSLASADILFIILQVIDLAFFITLALGAALNVKQDVSKLIPWFIGAPILYLILSIARILSFGPAPFFYFIINFIYCIACILAGIAIADKISKKTLSGVHTGVEQDGYISLGKHIVLCLFTFGIWYWIWIYRTTAYLNRTPDAEQYNPTSKLLLCIFVPFYSIYWYYKHGGRIDTLSRSRNLNHSDMATMCLILGIFIPIVACILMQDRINSLCTAANSSNGFSSSNQEEQQLNHIKQLKELYDNGVITEEEFETKKKQLLGL